MSSKRRLDEAERWRKVVVWSIAAFAGTLPFSHVPAQIALGIGAIGWVVWSVRSGRANIVGEAFFIPALIYWTWNILASAVSERPSHSLLALVDNEWPALVGVLTLWSLRSEGELRSILRVFFVSSGIAMLYGIVQTFTGVEWIKGAHLSPIGGGFYRAVGFSGFYLTFAGFAMTVFFLASAYALERPSSTARWMVPGLTILAILGTFARSVWLAMALLLPFAAWAVSRGKSRMVAVAVGCSVAALVFAVEPLRDRALSVFDLAQHETRLNLWKTSLAISRAHPVLGIGQDNFTTVFEVFRVEGFYDTFVHPHNDYLSVLVHGGVPALAAFIGMWVIVLKRGWDSWKRERGSLTSWIALGGVAALGGFLLSATFQNYYGTFVNCFNWWFISGILLTTYHLRSQSVQSNL
mgnify:CR=1 FL=1